MGFSWKGVELLKKVIEASLYRTDTQPDTSVKYLLVAVPLLAPLPQKAWEGTVATAQNPGECPAPPPFLVHPLTQTCQPAHRCPVSL